MNNNVIMYKNDGAFTYMGVWMREEKRKKVLFLTSIFMMLFFVIIGVNEDQNLVLGISVINDAEYQDLISDLEEIDFDGNLMYEETSIPYVENMYTYMVTQSIETSDWQGRIFSNDPSVKCYMLDPNMTKEEIIASGTPLKIVIICDEGYKVENLIVSGLPVISMSASSADEKNFYGTVKIFENASAGRTGVMDADEYSCRYRYRGQASMTSAKKSYKLNLLDSKGGSKKASLLGLKEDNDWVLNPLFYDQSLMREKIAYDIWNQMSDVNTHDIEYCELIVDGQYRGVYCVQEAVDVKTFGTPKSTSFLYSIKLWAQDIAVEELYNNEVMQVLMENDMLIDEYTIDECAGDNLELGIELLRCMDSSVKGKSYETELSVRFDVENTATYDVLVNMTQAVDNTYKNQKLCIYKENGNEYIITKSPWDLDWSMYNENIAPYLNPDDITIDALFFGDEEEYNSKRQEVYFMARDQFFDEEWANSVIDRYQQLLIQSGAIGRNTAIWGGDFQASCDGLREYFRIRIPALDEYYGGL